ncbi:MAG: bifunctional 5,10-methylene-tetrahydrofolate dehydrogenase/5,10-methylene-tetrahydrofolate cyclohydrolase, partial [Candidatus Portnoybacteria bacterium CG10_big_fil_rev_8_21_14_0_10_44_7]
MKILNGQKIASRITGELKKKLKNKKIKPKLAVILVGNNQSSKLYVELKEKKAREIGLDFTKYFFPASTTEKEILALIKQLNRDNLVSGILVQLPLPAFLDAEKIIGAIKP